MALIKAISDGKEATEEFINCRGGQFVYSAKNDQVVIELENLLEFDGVFK